MLTTVTDVKGSAVAPRLPFSHADCEVGRFRRNRPDGSASRPYLACCTLRRHWTARHSPQRQSLLLKIAARLLHQAELAGLGQVFHAPCNIRLGRNVAVQPDIFFVQDFRRGIIGEDQIYGIPDLAVELQTDASPSAEHIERRRIYLRFGVPELWLIDTSRHAVEAFLWSEIGYIPSGASQEPGCLRSALFPELHFSLAGLF